MELLGVSRERAVPAVPFKVNQCKIRIGDVRQEGSEQRKDLIGLVSLPYPANMLRTPDGILQKCAAKFSDFIGGGYRLTQNKSPGSDIVIKAELIRMGPRPQSLYLVCHLVVDPSLDDILREDITLEKEFMIRIQSLQ